MKQCDNRYKICRENAGYTQLQAAELLHICGRSLSDYENGNVAVKDEMVDAMAHLYNAPLLAWWHIKETSVLGKYLPDLLMPSTNGDMAFQAILAQDELDPAVHNIKQIMSDGVIDDSEQDKFATSIKQIKQVTNKLLSVTAYAEQKDADAKRA